MELRLLQYFLAVAREESISAAANSLHLTQPTLSRQIKSLEDELEHPLIIRGTKKITLTEEGMILRKRAEEIMELVRKTETEIALADENIAGEVCFAAGETDGIRLFAKTIGASRGYYPKITYQFHSGNASFVLEQVEHGLADFGLLYGNVERSRYEVLSLPFKDRWGVLMLRDSPLAEKTTICPEDLSDKALIIPHQDNHVDILEDWFQTSREELPIISTYTLAFNASLLVSEGVGYALMFDNLINVSGDGNLCFRLLFPAIESQPILIWKKYQELGKAPKKFLEMLEEIMRKAEAGV